MAVGGRKDRDDEGEKGAVGSLGKRPETIKSDFQTTVNVYDFQGVNYLPGKKRGAKRAWEGGGRVSRDWDRPHNFEIN